MTSYALFSFCLVVLLAHWNEVMCDSELSPEDALVERVRREAAIELYHRMKRQGSLNVDAGLRDGNDPFARAELDRRFGRNGRHRVNGHVDVSRSKGLDAGLGADFRWNGGRTRLRPSVSFGPRGFRGAGISFTHRFGKRKRG